MKGRDASHNADQLPKVRKVCSTEDDLDFKWTVGGQETGGDEGCNSIIIFLAGFTLTRL
jgi:hypothetical protein